MIKIGDRKPTEREPETEADRIARRNAENRKREERERKAANEKIKRRLGLGKRK